MSQNDERRKIRVADTNTLVDPSTLRDDAGLQRARETGYRGRMCEKDGQCRFPRCTFLHSLVVHQAQSTAPARGGGKQGYGRAGGPAAARPPRETPTTKTVTDANQEILEDLVDLLSEENAAELFKQRIAEKTISAVAAFLRDGSGDPFNVIKVASMMLHIICNATPVDPTTDDEKKQQERESGLVLDGVKWFKGLTDVSLQKPRYAKYLQRIVFALLRRIPGDLATGFVTNANLLRAAIPAEEKDVSVWNYYDEMLKAERERQPAAHRSNDDGEPQRRQRRGPTEYTDTDQRQDNAPIDEILINEKDFSDRREKKEILHSLHGIVVDDPVPVDKERRHLEEQFRTFREDFVAAMRSAVKIVRRVVPPQTIPNLQTAQLSRDFQDAIKKCDEDGDVRLYNVATYVGVKPVKSRLVFEFAIDMNQFKNYKANWDKRMMNGNLVMLSTNWFHPGAPIFAGTIERANNRRNDKGNAPQRREEFDGTFGIEVEDPVEMLRLVSHHKGKLVFRMLESTSFFLPYHRVLTVFKETLEKDHNPPSRLERVLGQRPPPTLLPLARELLEGRTDVAPAYIRRSHHLSIGRAISLQEIAIAQDQRVGLDVLDKGAWDLCSEWSSELEAQLAAKGNTFHTIDTTQRDALQHIFSHSVAVVQGTPGTGKTFIGAKFVQIIMQNIARIDCGPIVCICLTNHAIDAFLEQMLTFEKKESIVRLGTMSKNEVIAELSLRSPAKKVFYPKNPEQEQLISEFQIQKRLIDQLVGKHQNLTPSLQEELFRKLQQLRRVGLDVGHLERVLLQDQCVIDDAVRMKKEGLSAIANMLWQLEDKRQTILESYRLDPNIRSKSQLVECKQKRDSIVGKLLTASLHLKKKFDEYFANQEEDVPPSIELAVSKFRALDAERKQSVQENKAQLEQLERQLHQMTQQSEPNNRRKAKKNKSKGQASPNPETKDGNKEQLTTDIALQRNIIAEEEVKIDESSKFMRDNKFKEYLALQQDCNKTPSYDAVYDELVASFDSAATLHERRNGIQRDLGKLLDQLKTPSLLRWCKYVPGPAPAPPPPPPPPASVALRPHDAAAVEAEMNARAEMEARAVQRGYSAMHRAVDDDDDDNDDDVGNVQFDDRFNHDSLTRECHNLTALLRRYDLSDAPDHIRTDVYQKILWIAECQGNTRLQEIINQLATGRKKFEEAEAKVTADALRRHRIIGATTTGAATYVSALRLLRPKVVIVEEAAEVLECQVLSCLPDSVEHLILVGDHKQLQPKVEQEMILGRKKHLSVSLMERLVRIDAPYVTLTTQRRMHPEISFFTKDYYKYPTHPKDKAVDVVDHPSTTLREVPKGVADDRRIIFVAHDGSTPSQCEQENPGLKSKFNSYEAELAVAIAEWLIRHNPTMSVTILAPYSGQVIKTIEFAKKNHVELLTRLKPKGVKIISIDDYQGEESDIIILTLTRTREMGFLKQENRSCVALSRARCGMYIIGCKPLLENTEKNATNLILRRMMDAVNVRLKDVNDGGDGRPDACCVVSQFPAVCPKHPTETLNFSTFKEQEQLTCKKLCGAQLGGCKHHCTKLCHVDTVGHSVCVEQCGRLGAGCHPPRQCTHVCKKKCGDKCGECQEKVDHTCPNCGVVAQVACGKLAANKHRCVNIVHNVVCRVNPENHTFSAPCWKSNDDTFNECKHPCNQKMKCGHTCQRTCHADDEHHETGSLTCQQYRDAPHPKCKKHTINARCCDLAKEIVAGKGKAARNAIPKCDKKCGCEVPACHHPCENTCGDCTEHTCLTGTRNIKIRACGHTHTGVKCKDVNTFSCTVPCTFQLHCGHVCPGTCGSCKASDKWYDHQPCRDGCLKMLVCGHKCKGSCNTACRPCTEPCKYNCGHGTGCDKMSTANRHECGDCPNRNCQELCAWSCKHKQCSKRCNDHCDREACLEPCPEIITCPKGHKHRCLGVCGEQCPPFCRTCFVEHRQKNTVYDQRQSVATLEVDVMSEELDSLLLGTLIDEEFLKAVPESNTRLVFLPCCGGIVLAGDLDRHIQAVCSSNEIVPPKCFRCQSVIQPGYYKKQGSLLKKRHQEITEVQQHLLDKFDIVDEGVDGLIESLKSLAQRCVFGANFVLSDHEKDSEGAQWIDALEEYSGSEQPTKPILLKGKKGKRPSQDIEKRNAEVEEKWKKAKETLKALENAAIDKCPRRIRLDSGSPSAQRLIQTILELLRRLVQRKSTVDDNALKEARARVESIDALAHYLELRCQHSNVAAQPTAHSRMLQFQTLHDKILRDPAIPLTLALEAKVLVYDFRLDVVQHAIQESQLRSNTGTPPHVPRVARYSDVRPLMEPLLQRATQFVNDQQYFQRGVGRAHFIPNPCMIASCSAFQRFAKGASLTQLLDISAQCQIAFHGTAKEAVGAICCRGFDVARRHGQAHGPGEYFGATADISASYARGSEQMIVCALITNKVANCQGGSILVVNNPTNDPSQTFVIPLGVVLFGATTLNHQLAPGRRVGEDVFSCTYPKQDASLAQGKQLVDTARRRCSEPISPEAHTRIIVGLENVLKKLEEDSGILRPSRDVLQLLTQALGVTAGHWYKCSKGHLYVIGDCGGAMTTATCPTCGETIGGGSHALVATSSSAASDVQQGAQAAWPLGRP